MLWFSNWGQYNSTKLSKDLEIYKIDEVQSSQNKLGAFYFKVYVAWKQFNMQETTHMLTLTRGEYAISFIKPSIKCFWET